MKSTTMSAGVALLLAMMLCGAVVTASPTSPTSPIECDDGPCITLPESPFIDEKCERSCTLFFTRVLKCAADSHGNLAICFYRFFRPSVPGNCGGCLKRSTNPLSNDLAAVMASGVASVSSSGPPPPAPPAVEPSDAPTPANVGPDPTKVYIESISYSGSGCPQGTVGSSFANDRASFTLIFDSFVASTGPGVPITESRKECTLFLNIHMPYGWEVTVGTTDFRGYVQLPAGVSAQQSAVAFAQGDSNEVSLGSTPFSGPVAKDYLARDYVGVQTLSSTCSGVKTIVLRGEVGLISSGGVQAQITTDSIDMKLTHAAGLPFGTC